MIYHYHVAFTAQLRDGSTSQGDRLVSRSAPLDREGLEAFRSHIAQELKRPKAVVITFFALLEVAG